MTMVSLDGKPIEGLPVSGYRPQQRAAVDAVNLNKELEERVLRRIDELRLTDCFAGRQGGDPRWLAIARTHIEQGFMAMNRAIFKPGRVALPGDDDHEIPPHLAAMGYTKKNIKP